MAKSKAEKWRTEEGLIKLSGWAKDGLTDEQIARNCGVSRSTLNVWREKYKDISDTLKRGREVADREVENALYKSAIGHKETVKKVFRVKDELVEAEEEIYIPPNVTAQIFWLKNRKRDVWRDKIEQSLEISGDDTGISLLAPVIDVEAEETEIAEDSMAAAAEASGVHESAGG